MTSIRYQLLKDRAHMLAEARQFFAKHHVMEVDVPVCTHAACIDAHIDLFRVYDHHSEVRYLQSSPEYGMKRLLSEGMGDIYQISHVFREGEVSVKHNPEFTMVEWYRCGFTLEQMAVETVAFVELFLGTLSYSLLTYRSAIKTFAGIDYVHANEHDLRHCLIKHGISLSESFADASIDDLLNLIMGNIVEPYLGNNGLTVLIDYPASQCALAETSIVDGAPVAKRFELYYKGYELANGYQELSDVTEQKKRLIESNQERIKYGKSSLPIDEKFLAALEKGLPACSGVAVGFDRLMMLRNNCDDIKLILPFGWNEA